MTPRGALKEVIRALEASETITSTGSIVQSFGQDFLKMLKEAVEQPDGPIPQQAEDSRPKPKPKPNHCGLSPSERYLIDHGSLIQAIKEIRIRLRVGLKEAKEMADTYRVTSADPMR